MLGHGIIMIYCLCCRSIILAASAQLVQGCYRSHLMAVGRRLLFMLQMCRLGLLFDAKCSLTIYPGSRYSITLLSLIWMGLLRFASAPLTAKVIVNSCCIYIGIFVLSIYRSWYSYRIVCLFIMIGFTILHILCFTFTELFSCKYFLKLKKKKKNSKIDL